MDEAHRRLLHLAGRHARHRTAGAGAVPGGGSHYDQSRGYLPHGVDPADLNIRTARSLPPVAELEQAAQVLCTCLRLAALEKLGV